MPSKQELELEVVNLTRENKDLKEKIESLGKPTTESVDNGSILLALQDELRSLKEKHMVLTRQNESNEKLIASLNENQALLTEELSGFRSKQARRSAGLVENEDGSFEVEQILNAGELVELVKFQFLMKDRHVAILKRV